MNKQWFKHSRKNNKDKILSDLKSKYKIDDEDLEKLAKM
jgi:hypothetical protein